MGIPWGLVAAFGALVALEKWRGRPTEEENPEFFTAGGIVHPIRGTRGSGGPYSEGIVAHRAAHRAYTGETSADQQLASQFDRWTRREEEKRRRAEDREKIKRRAHQDREERLYHLSVERDTLAEELENEPAARYTGLIRSRGEMRGEVGLIPFEQARKAGLEPDRFKGNVIHRDKFGRKYLRWEYALDQKATELGYSSGDDFKDAIERAARQRAKLAEYDREIRALERH